MNPVMQFGRKAGVCLAFLGWEEIALQSILIG